MTRALLLVILAACSRTAPPPAPGSAEQLAAYLQSLAGADAATRRHEVTGWVLSEQTWEHTIVDPFRALYADYARSFDAQVPTLVTRLATRGTITARRHWAGDRRLTDRQARLRWTVPPQYPSMVAELDGQPIDTVFIFDGASWRALAGVDELVVARTRALDPHCADLLVHAGPPGRCTEIGWLVADAALRTDRARFDHACALAKTACGNPSP